MKPDPSNLEAIQTTPDRAKRYAKAVASLVDSDRVRKNETLGGSDDEIQISDQAKYLESLNDRIESGCLVTIANRP